VSKTVEVRFDTSALDKALRRLSALQASETLARGVHAGMTLVAEEARRSAPDSGLSRDSTRKSMRGGKKYPHKLKDEILVKKVQVSHKRVLGRVVALPFYTGFVERGVPSRGIRPNPFMRNSAQSRRGDAVKKFQDSVREMVEEALR
jgi:hypothetical protein